MDDLIICPKQKKLIFSEGTQVPLLPMGRHGEGGQFPGAQESKLSGNPNQGFDFYKICLLVALQMFLHVFLGAAANLLS